MLVLQRNTDSMEKRSIVITSPEGEQIIIYFLESRNGGHSVRLGVEAPNDYKINRGEHLPDTNFIELA